MVGELHCCVLDVRADSLLFFGGWLSPIPGLPDGALWMVGKMALSSLSSAMVKAITPRYRYDQLMRLGGKSFCRSSLFGWFSWRLLAKFEVLAAPMPAGL